ncbi:MAG: DnaJ domain-containing protein, partial [Acetobacteraceae bacterium]|nr:DnaJ domain-containing protein [Acetobacteraceae bacterium]
MPSNTSDAWQLRWRDYYQALGIYCEASEQEVKHAFALKARLLHPDHLAGHSEDVRGIANGEMRLLIEARDVLQDQASRARYDKAYKLRDVSPAEAEAERLRERASQERERQAARDDGYRNGYAEASAKLQLAVAAARQEGFQAGEASAWTKVRDNSPIWCDFEASWLSAPPVFGQSPALQLQMEAYLVAAASTNQQLESELRRSPGGWRRMHYVWLVLRAEDTETFYNKLHNTLPDQFLFVMAVRQPCQGWLPGDDWDWLSRYSPTTNVSPPVPNLQFPGY